ncbi:TonB-dependent receptor [Sinomicrobium oceani]|uniref:TonB-dependent receptor n=1 Tax=Sinomicrobium oceani TaxID=1150368 RepID=A0A1K1RC42_9FLAO|nr:TonB-dependent receptor [Sinomicrobium oceani]SFW69640.1 TonB-dependent receptor [Sinomicrobium oceani]
MRAKIKEYCLIPSRYSGKVCLLFFLILSIQTTRSNHFEVQQSGQSLKAFIEKLIEETPYSFLFDESQLGNVILIRPVEIRDRAIRDILADVNRQIPIEYNIEGKNISIRTRDRQRQKTGRLNGHVYDDRQVPLPGANIIIENKGTGISTGFDGDYDLLLPTGVYTVRISYISFKTQEVTGVVITPGNTTTLDVILEPASEALQEVVVTAQYDRRVNNVAALNTIRKNEVTAIDGITAAQIARTPDNDVAQVLTRVTGLHVQDNKYVVVRGVSERYNNVAMNNALMPSTEANRRNYAFDIIPSNLIESVIVHKTASPELPGEFTGGYVNINTLEIPNKNFLTLEVGTGGNENTFNDFYSLPRYKNDYLGLMTSGSKLPALAGELSNNADFSPETLLPLSKQMPGNNRFRLNRYTQQPTQNYALGVGKVIRLSDDNRLGMTAALTYRNEQSKQGYYEETQGTREIVGGDRYNFLSRTGGIFNITYAFGTQKISLKNTFYQKLETENTVYNGINLYVGQPKTGITEERVVNSFGQSVLNGEHTTDAPNAYKFKWNIGIANYTRNQPNNLQIEGVNENLFYDSADRELIAQEFRKSHPPYQYVKFRTLDDPLYDYYSKYQEKRYTMGFNLELPLSVTHSKNKLVTGYSGSIRDVDFDQSRYAVLAYGEWAARRDEFVGLPLYEVINQEAFDNEYLYYRPISSGSDASVKGFSNGFKGTQGLHAVFLMLDTYFTGKLHFSGGVRLEDNTMKTETGIRTLDDVDGAGIDNSTETDAYTFRRTNFLPSANLIYELTPKMNLRTGYFMSLARPEFTELGNYSYFDYNLRTLILSGYSLVSGGEEKLLEQTTIDNLELRWEYYPTANESFSVAGFYKSFDKPIELQVLQSAQNVTTALKAGYFNLDRATNYGVEIDFRKSFGFLQTTFGENLYLFGNASFIWSKIYYDREDVPVDTGETDEEGNPVYREAVVEDNRPLYGQSPYIINGGLQYTGKHFGLTATYNRVGPRIILPAGEPFYDEYEKPRNVLDLQFRYAFLKENRAEIRLNLADILNDPVIRYMNNIDSETKNPRVDYVENSDDGGRKLAVPQHDPSGKSYDSRYDLVRRRYDRLRSFNITFKYTF